MGRGHTWDQTLQKTPIFGRAQILQSQKDPFWPTLSSAVCGWAGLWNWIHIGGTHGWSPYLMCGLVGSGSLWGVHHLRKSTIFTKQRIPPLPPSSPGGGKSGTVGVLGLCSYPLPGSPKHVLLLTHKECLPRRHQHLSLPMRCCMHT